MTAASLRWQPGAACRIDDMNATSIFSRRLAYQRACPVMEGQAVAGFQSELAALDRTGLFRAGPMDCSPPKLTMNYGIRYERYPAPYRDRTGVSVLVPTLPQSGNVEVGGVGGNPEDAGNFNVGWGMIVPRIGFDYRLTEKTVLRTGFGITTDPDSMRYLRDAFPEDLAPVYVGTGTGTIAVDPANTTNYASGQPMTLTYGIPSPAVPNYTSGFASLPISGSTNTVAQNFRRGYLESWNLFVQQDLGHQWVGNVGYVGQPLRPAACGCRLPECGAIPIVEHALHGQRPIQPFDWTYWRLQLQRQRNDQRAVLLREGEPGLLQHRRHHRQFAAVRLLL